jgi:hypothetical protein
MSQPITTEVNLPNGTKLRAVEVAPGFLVADLPDSHECPIYGFISMESIGDQKFVAKVKIWPALLRLTENATEVLGLGMMNPRILKRLAFAGFIETIQFTPGTTLLNLESFFKHLHAAKDPEFWTPARLELYKQATAAVR